MSSVDPAVVAVPVTLPPKNPLVSKTMIVNGVVFLIGGLAAWLAPDTLAQLDPKVIVWLGTGLAALNMLLRTVTTQPVAFAAPMRSVAIAGIVGSVIAGVVGASPVAPQAAAADGGVLTAVILPDSTATVVLSPDGRWGRITWVTPGPGPLPPTPTPPNPPNPVVVLSDRAKAIKAEADAVKGDPAREETAQGLARIYRMLAELARTPGQVQSPTSLSNGAKKAANDFLATRAGTTSMLAAWQPMRDVLSTQWTTLVYQDLPPSTLPPATLEDYAKLLSEAADGLESSAPSKQLSPAMLQLILQIIQMVLSLLKPS